MLPYIPPSPLSKLPHPWNGRGGSHDEATPSSVKCRVAARVPSWRRPQVGTCNVSVSSPIIFSILPLPMVILQQSNQDDKYYWRCGSMNPLPLFLPPRRSPTILPGLAMSNSRITPPRLRESGGADAGKGMPSPATGALRCHPWHSD